MIKLGFYLSLEKYKGIINKIEKVVLLNNLSVSFIVSNETSNSFS